MHPRSLKPWLEQGLYEHGVYMQTLFDEDRLLYGGPFDDHTGGLAIMTVESEAEAQAIVDEDPAVVDGTFDADLHPWMVVFAPREISRLF